MEEDILEDIGLSKNEAKVYLSLVRLGSTGVNQIVEKSKVHRTNVYEVLERLIEKGLVSYFYKKDKKYFEANDPICLINILKEKEIHLKNILPQLLQIKNQLKKKVEVHVSEGLNAVRDSEYNHLKWNQPIYTMGSPKKAAELGSEFLNEFHKERIKNKIPMYHIYNDDAVERITKIKKWPFTEVRTLPSQYNAPVSTNICGDEVTLKIWGKDAIVIVLKSKEVANSYKKYHDILWRTAKKA